ncbi:MAG TPA: isochorismatase family protein [Verrucomicrobiae bacterium]|jgi:nicotinamidase/pyrazinamidase|nr:isochorismatase family protein [Verrucomicrobiae bacterium]
MNHNKALVIIDAQRCFMPAVEGERLGVEGFGELPAPNGQRIVAPLNKLTRTYEHGMLVATTQDAHLKGTAHISDNPDFVTTWPEHGIKDTPGSALHPELIAAGAIARHFIKGDVIARTPAEDESYTGALAHAIIPEMGGDVLLPDYLRFRGTDHLYLGGIAIGSKERPLCVDQTAIDLHEQGFQVAIVTDAAESIVAEDREACLEHLGAMGIRLITTGQAQAEVFASLPEIIQ